MLIQRGYGKSSFLSLVEIENLYQTGRITLDDYIDIMTIGFKLLFNVSDERINEWVKNIRRRDSN